MKTKQNEEKKILWVNDFPCIPYNFFLLKLLPAPLSARQSFSLLTRNVPKPGEFPIKFSPGLSGLLQPALWAPQGPTAEGACPPSDRFQWS